MNPKKNKRGRPKLEASERRDIHIGVRVNPDEDRRINGAAGRINKATWVRIAALKVANQ